MCQLAALFNATTRLRGFQDEINSGSIDWNDSGFVTPGEGKIV